MRKIRIYDKIVFAVVLIFLASIISSAKIAEVASEETELEIQTLTITQSFSIPEIKQNEEYLEINVEEANSVTIAQGMPALPVFTKTFELPWGSKIVDIHWEQSDVESLTLDKKIQPVPIFNPVGFSSISVVKRDVTASYQENELYPLERYHIQTGTGINKNGQHVLYVTLFVNPVRNLPIQGTIEYITDFEATIEYKQSGATNLDSNEYDLVIITPEIFAENLTKFVDHKENFGVKTNLTILHDIYMNYPGRDKPEKIKYFVKYALDEWGVKYVLLVGDLKNLPIRQTDAYPWHEFHGSGILSDLYYSDIYDANYSFASWDTNDNGIYGEVKYSNSFLRVEEVIDEVDLYPDLHIGRLACRNLKELDIVVNKIITYEEDTYEQTWFKKIVLAGGDTFPPAKMSLPFVYEGEITNDKVAQQLPDFEHTRLWASKRNLNAWTFNRAINKGAGFVSYAGHGFEHGWGTYRPNALRGRFDFNDPRYYTPFIQFLKNQNKLPIIFWDACLTAKLDFNIMDMAAYYKPLDIFIKLVGVEPDPTNYYTCFAWRFLIEEDGGAVGTIGATRPAYSHVNQNGVHAGAGYLDFMFFKNYEDGICFGDMFSRAQIDYVNNKGRDYFTIEEYIILGDPSLKIGGYP
jgi:hypothetical protein